MGAYGENRILARRVGSMLPVPATLRVHSVYKRAVNLVPPDTRVFASLVTELRDMAATAILVDTLPTRLRVGAPASLCEDGMRIDGQWRIPLRAAARWDGRLAARADYDVSAASAEVLATLLVNAGRPGGLLGLIHTPAENTISAFARGLLDSAFETGGSTGDAGWASIDLSALVGLGAGLTPSGDDFLTGAMMAQEICRLNGRNGRQLNLEAVRRRLHATTAAGETLLSAALESRFPAYLIILCNRIFLPAPGPSADKDSRLPLTGIEAQCLLDHGQTSATDAVVGALWFLSKIVTFTA